MASGLSSFRENSNVLFELCLLPEIVGLSFKTKRVIMGALDVALPFGEYRREDTFLLHTL